MVRSNRASSRSSFTKQGWKRSSYCGPNGGDCLEVNASQPHDVGLRDSKLPSGSLLTFTAQRWGEFVAAIRCGQFDQWHLR